MSETPDPPPADDATRGGGAPPPPGLGAGENAGSASVSSTGLDTKLAGLLCYVFGFVSGVVFLIVEQRDRDVRFHAYQSTLTFGFLFVLSLVAAWVPWFGWVIGLLIGPFSFVLWVILMWKAFEGERFKLPVVGEWAAEQAEGHA